MEIAGLLLATMFNELNSIIKPSMSTLEIDFWIENYLKKNGLISSSKGYLGYKHSSCISLNDEVVHGVPTNQKRLNVGDLLKIDVCASFKGYCADMARCFFIGEPILQDAKRLVEVAQSALDYGIANSWAGNHISDISAAIEHEVSQYGYGIVREFAGHGIGKKMHEDPEILNYGKPGCGPLIKSGMAFAIEPMITLGDHRVYIANDGWTVKTVDKSLAAHVEDTIIVTDNGPKIITRL
jgi:methionyl aminopeptidase